MAFNAVQAMKEAKMGRGQADKVDPGIYTIKIQKTGYDKFPDKPGKAGCPFYYADLQIMARDPEDPNHKFNSKVIQKRWLDHPNCGFQIAEMCQLGFKLGAEITEAMTHEDMLIMLQSVEDENPRFDIEISPNKKNPTYQEIKVQWKNVKPVLKEEVDESILEITEEDQAAFDAKQAAEQAAKDEAESGEKAAGADEGAASKKKTVKKSAKKAVKKVAKKAAKKSVPAAPSSTPDEGAGEEEEPLTYQDLIDAGWSVEQILASDEYKHLVPVGDELDAAGEGVADGGEDGETSEEEEYF